MITEKSLSERYDEYDKRVIDFLVNITKSIKDKESNDEYYYCMYDLLAMQLHLYFKSCDQLMQIKELTSEDNYKRLAKSPLVSILQKCHTQILDIMQKLSLSPFEQARLKRVKIDDDQSAEEILNKLIA